jgi:HK97 family phage major capsid protein
MPTAIDELDVSFTVPDDADGLREVIADTVKMNEVFKAHGAEGWAVLNAAYAEAALARDRGQLEEQMLEQAEIRAHEIATENGAELSGRLNLTPEALHAQLAAAASPKRGKWYNESAPGAAIEGHWANNGDWIRAAIIKADSDATTRWADGSDIAAKIDSAREISNAYSSHIGPSGGFLMPESFRNDLLQIAHEESVVRGRAVTIPMGTPKVTLPAIHETNRSSTLFGGIQMYWTEEDADSTSSEARFKTVSIEPDTLTGYTEIPNETLQDTLAFSAYFDATFPRAMAFEEDYAFLQGTGIGQPLGMLNADCNIAVAARAGQAATTLIYENMLDMWARMLPGSHNRAVWVLNQDTIPELGTMALSVGTGGAPIFLMNAATGMPMSLFGRPIVFSEKVNTLGTNGDVGLYDFGFYLIGDLQTVTVTSSTEYKFKERRTAFSIVERVDGQPWVETAITPRHGTNTLSPVVTLATRS